MGMGKNSYALYDKYDDDEEANEQDSILVDLGPSRRRCAICWFPAIYCECVKCDGCGGMVTYPQVTIPTLSLDFCLAECFADNWGIQPADLAGVLGYLKAYGDLPKYLPVPAGFDGNGSGS